MSREKRPCEAALAGSGAPPVGGDEDGAGKVREGGTGRGEAMGDLSNFKGSVG